MTMTDIATKLEASDGREASDLTRLLSAGQLEPGDIIQTTFKGETKRYDVEDVLNPGTDREEIILDIHDNLYFITSMAIDGTSWAKDVMIEDS